jgi:hypothetical protein
MPIRDLENLAFVIATARQRYVRLPKKARFARDSPLEGEGFELSVPGHWTSIYRRKLVWEIERKLAEDGGRPGIYYARTGYCSYPYVKNLTIMVNSNYNGWRFEDVWLDR